MKNTDSESCQCNACKATGPHTSDCAVHNAPAMEPGPCNCRPAGHKTFVIYHRADNDGLCCREIARHFLPGAELIGLDYNEAPPVIPTDAKLYILDLSVPELMDHPDLVWIDHHKTAIERFPATIPGYRIDGVAACRLAWQWFACRALAEAHAASVADFTLPTFEDFRERRVDEPLAVRLIGENDIWDHRDPRVRQFKAGLRSQEIDWPELLGGKRGGIPYVEHLLACAPYVSHASREGLLYLMRENSFTLEWEGIRFLAVNAAGLSSDAYELVADKEHEAGLSFVWNPKRQKWKVSMRALRKDLDLSDLAKKRGGGGHRAACGFECDFLPFEPFSRTVCDEADVEARMKKALHAMTELFPGRAFTVIVFPGAPGQAAHLIGNGRKDDTRRALRRVVATLETGAAAPSRT